MLRQQVKRPSEISPVTKRVVSILLIVTLLLGLVHSLAWVFRYAALLDYWPGRARMSFHTSISMIIAAAGVGTMLKVGAERLTFFLGILLGVLSLFSLTEGIFGLGFSLNDLVRTFAQEMHLPAITSVYTSSAFLLTSLAILLHFMRASRRIPMEIGIASIAVMAIGIAAVVAYLFRIIPESPSNGLGSVSLPTAVGIALLGTSLVTIEVMRYPWEDDSWAPSMLGTLTLVTTLVMWQALDNNPDSTVAFPHMFLLGGLLLTILTIISAYSALIARRNLKLARAKERELLDLNTALENRIRERTRDLANSNAELERFALIAAHDLKSPINSMTQFAEVLSEELDLRLSPKEKQYLSFITRAGERARRMIDSLLQYAKIGSRACSFEMLNASVIAQDAEENLHFDAVYAKAEIAIQPLPTIYGDRIQLTQLFQNLLTNAIKFRKRDRHPIVRIYVQEEGTSWRFSVADNGIGIPAKQSSKIFEVFSRLHSEEEYPGTGLGLAMCRRIVENHRGRIWVESEPDQGTTFHFTLPKMGLTIHS